jgi:uncharacterized membrane protein YgcG
MKFILTLLSTLYISVLVSQTTIDDAYYTPSTTQNVQKTNDVYHKDTSKSVDVTNNYNDYNNYDYGYGFYSVRLMRFYHPEIYIGYYNPFYFSSYFNYWPYRSHYTGFHYGYNRAYYSPRGINHSMLRYHAQSGFRGNQFSHGGGGFHGGGFHGGGGHHR